LRCDNISNVFLDGAFTLAPPRGPRRASSRKRRGRRRRIGPVLKSRILNVLLFPNISFWEIRSSLW
jgi:hypothetical protein